MSNKINKGGPVDGLRLWRNAGAYIARGGLRVGTAGLLSSAVLAGGAAFAGASALGAPSLAAKSAGSCASGAQRVTYWSWDNDAASVADFNKTHPKICVVLENEGATTAEFAKLDDAINAKAGVPDVAQLSWGVMEQLALQHDLLNMGDYGVASLKTSYPSAVWNQANFAGGVYALPDDSTNLDLMYNKALVAKYHLSIPTTWEQFLADGEKLHKEAPSVALSDFAPGMQTDFLAELVQAGAKPFVLNGSNLSIGFTSAPAMKFASLWDTMIRQHLVLTSPAYTTQWVKQLTSGQMVMMPVEGWFPGYFQSEANSPGWALAQLPEWAGGPKSGVECGGSPLVVLSATKVPQAAVEFVKWTSTNLQNWQVMEKAPDSLFPMDVAARRSPALLNATLANFGSQKFNTVFANSVPMVNFGAQFAPFELYAQTETEDMLNTVAQGKETVAQGLKQLQSTFTSYAKKEGFKVS